MSLSGFGRAVAPPPQTAPFWHARVAQRTPSAKVRLCAGGGDLEGGGGAPGGRRPPRPAPLAFCSASTRPRTQTRKVRPRSCCSPQCLAGTARHAVKVLGKRGANSASTARAVWLGSSPLRTVLALATPLPRWACTPWARARAVAASRCVLCSRAAPKVGVRETLVRGAL